MRTRLPDDITIPTMKDNQTWNTCPECGKEWETIPAIPGLIHKTKLCDKCYPIVKARYEK